VAIFDGHTRYNLRLAFERFSRAHPVEGYQGQVVVCSAKFLPVAGYDPKHFLVTYLAAQHETEIWLAPLSGTRLLVPSSFYFNAHGRWRFGSNKICVRAVRRRFARWPLNELDQSHLNKRYILDYSAARAHSMTRL
jgi:hypothetical protein